MTIASNLGFPPMGAARELKRATEGYWSSKVSLEQLLAAGAELRRRHWQLQRDIGVDRIPANDFSFYDRMLDTCAMVGAVPPRYGWKGEWVDPGTYFAMARGSQGKGRDVTAMEMAKWVQLDEPCLALDRSDAERTAYRRAYQALAARAGKLRLLVATYFAGLGENLDTALALPVHGLHVDLVRAPGQLDPLLAKWPKGRVLSAGVIDGRNVWHADLAQARALLDRAAKTVGTNQLWVAPSCSLLHAPIDLDLETKLDPELKGWLAFAKQKLQEVVALAKGDRAAIEASTRAAQSRATSKRIHNAAVQRRAASVTEQDRVRRAPFVVRRKVQLELPPYPTTTIGSFPQTSEVRAARRKLNDNQLSADEYEQFIEAQIGKTIQLQEEIGLDVLVHGEFERNDMVEYFGEQLAGFAFTEHGWVQSYGTRYVKPPIIFGDVSRPRAMTVRWSKYAQSLTERPVKG